MDAATTIKTEVDLNYRVFNRLWSKQTPRVKQSPKITDGSGICFTVLVAGVNCRRYPDGLLTYHAPVPES